MSKPSIKPRIAHLVNLLHGGWVCFSEKKTRSSRVRVTAARDITVEQAIADTITRNVWLEDDGPLDPSHVPEGYSATVENGKVRVRRIEP